MRGSNSAFRCSFTWIFRSCVELLQLRMSYAESSLPYISLISCDCPFKEKKISRKLDCGLLHFKFAKIENIDKLKQLFKGKIFKSDVLIFSNFINKISVIILLPFGLINFNKISNTCQNLEAFLATRRSFYTAQILIAFFYFSLLRFNF